MIEEASKNMKWVLNTYQTAQDWSIERMVEICQKTGYAGVELLQDFNQAHGVEASATDEHVRSVHRRLSDGGLILSSLTSCCHFHDPNEEDRRRSIDQVKRVIDQAALVGCDHVRVLGDRLSKDDEAAREAVLEWVGAALGELGAYARPKGVTVSIEAHGSFTDPVYAVRVVKAAGSPNVGIVFNSQWRIGAEWGWSLPADATSIAPLYELLGPHLTSIHTHQMEHPDLWRFYREFFQLLARDNYKGYVSNECAYRGPDPEKVLRFYTTLFESFVS